MAPKKRSQKKDPRAGMVWVNGKGWTSKKEAERCDECEAMCVAPKEVSRHHMDSCSLYPDNVMSAPRCMQGRHLKNQCVLRDGHNGPCSSDGAPRTHPEHPKSPYAGKRMPPIAPTQNAGHTHPTRVNLNFGQGCPACDFRWLHKGNRAGDRDIIPLCSNCDHDGVCMYAGPCLTCGTNRALVREHVMSFDFGATELTKEKKPCAARGCKLERDHVGPCAAYDPTEPTDEGFELVEKALGRDPIARAFLGHVSVPSGTQVRPVSSTDPSATVVVLTRAQLNQLGTYTDALEAKLHDAFRELASIKARLRIS